MTPDILLRWDLIFYNNLLTSLTPRFLINRFFWSNQQKNLALSFGSTGWLVLVVVLRGRWWEGGGGRGRFSSSAHAIFQGF
jgi:hypothetical protein